jgi:hypothetical protein
MDPASAGRGALSIEEISSAAQAVAAAGDLARMAERLLAVIQSWAAPSLIACLERDPSVEAGWRLEAGLISGHVPPGIERSIAKIVGDDDAGPLTRPTRIRPADDLPGRVRIRDTWVVPWSSGDTSGVLLLRGVSHPCPDNLGAAVALVALSLWPRLMARRGASADPAKEVLDRLEQAIDAVQRAAGRLIEAEPEGARPSAAQPPDTAAPPPVSPADGEVPEAARAENEALRERMEALEDSRAAAEADRDRAAAEAEGATAHAEAAERAAEESARAAEQAEAALEKERVMAAVLKEAIDEAKAAFAASEAAAKRSQLALAERQAEVDEARKEREEARRRASSLQIRIEGLERSMSDARLERDHAKATANQLWASLESLQKEVQAEREREASQGDRVEADRRAQEEAGRWAAERAREQVRAAEAFAAERVRQTEERARRAEELRIEAEARASEAEEQVRELLERWAKAEGAFRGAVETLRRTPFVPPTLRVSFSDAEAVLGAREGVGRRDGATAHVLFLDRDVPGLEALSRALEAGRVEVLIAHYPEEVAFFLKTAASRRVTALVCDVMAFRADQDLLETLGGWRRDLPNLPVILSFKADVPLEAERAQRVPVTLTAGYLPRPMELRALTDALAAITRRTSSPSRAGGA